MLKYFALCVFSYLIGSLSISIFASRRILGGDVRTKGSGNAGATNMARVYGIGPGLLTLLADMAKAAVTMIVGYKLLGENGLMLSGIFCLMGHCFPAYYNFRGGKGVSSGAAVAFALGWRIGLIAAAVFAAVAFSSRKVSPASICAAISIPVTALLFSLSPQRIVLAVFAACLVVLRHRENIKRLIAGTEADFKLGK